MDKSEQGEIVWREARFGDYGMEHREAVKMLQKMGYKWISPEYDGNGSIIVGTGVWIKGETK